uniref:Reverse transcriptase Ty1/copia-type domain-containing protein n=2 Tax=Chromera velia CCMP2878 TaxID=1169474 RepID=A0A0G4HFP3_9ALVE|eukprot:Cvel_26974.t1-p1 / transcript=Cvel_26974.t1 / gene=Cvel_26974 / organism=Chromera_velia_CCMP2878 / gene_product=hypothetical protein / transcript_product=hypothetical protein / location=Cvel_scaffold3291:15891-17381(+) / protein_length=497 / sequence_SO=supercontig / SO=protein_coding / is_pseudo=false
MHHNNINHRLVVSCFQWSEGQSFPFAPETANAAMSPVVFFEAMPVIVPPSASADVATQPSGMNQEEEEWGRVKEELFGDRALEMKAEERQVQEEGGAILIVKQRQPTLSQMQSNCPSLPIKISYSRRMLQWNSDVCRFSEEFGGDAPFLALASFREGATMLPASREEIVRGEFWEANVKEWAAILHTKMIGKRRSHLELAAVLNMGFARNHKEDLNKGPGGRKKKTRIYVAAYDELRKVDIFSGTPNRDCFLLTLLYVAIQGFEVELVDIKNAFLQSPDDYVEHVGVHILKSIPTMPAQKPSFLTEYSDAEWGEIRKEAERVVPGQIYELSNALYGTPPAPALWGKELRRGQEKLGFVPIEQLIAVRREAEDEPAQDVQATHVDDIFGAGERTEEAFDVLGERFTIGSRTKVNVGSKAKYIGMDIYRSDAHTFELTSESYLEGINIDAIPGKLKKSLLKKDVAPAKEQDMDMFLQGVYQEANGVLGWAVCLNWRRAL